MTAIDAGRAERGTVFLQTNTGCDNRRTCTDKVWIILFIVLLIIWKQTSGQGIIQRKTGCELDIELNRMKIQISPLNKTHNCNVTYQNQTIANTTPNWVTQIWGKNWLFDAITCNVGFLDAHYEKSGPIVIWAHVLICVGLIIYYSFVSIRRDYFFRKHFMEILFFCCSTYLTRTHYYEGSSFQVFALCWVLPDAILLIIVCTKVRNGYVEPGADEKEAIQKCFRVSPFPYYMMFFYVLMMWSFAFVYSVRVYKFDWDNQLSYVLVGIICYMCLVAYHFILAVTSCSTCLSLDSEVFCTFLNAFFIVVRYHFGTVCYHATLIFPRIHSTFIMNRKEFREISKFSPFRRFYLTHWKVHSLSLMMTASRGCNHSKSMKELLKLFVTDSPKLKNFQTHSQIFRILSALTIATNNLLLIGLWADGALLDPHLFVGICVSYFIGTIIGYFVVAKLHDAVRDAVWFHHVGNKIHRL